MTLPERAPRLQASEPKQQAVEPEQQVAGPEQQESFLQLKAVEPEQALWLQAAELEQAPLPEEVQLPEVELHFALPVGSQSPASVHLQQERAH